MKIKSTLLLIVICLAAATLVKAQEEVYRAEVYGGYLFNSIQSSSGSSTYVIPGCETGSTCSTTSSSSSSSRRQMQGFNVSITGNSSKSVGWQFDVSHVGRTDSSGSGTGAAEIKSSLQQYLGGVQFKNNIKGEARFKPFAHVLAGIARQYAGTGGTGTGSSSSHNDFAMLFGGGIDVKLNKRVDLRVIQFDYNPIFVKTRNGIEGYTQNNFRIGIGLVFH
jgi:opacity protein-like surface antigen